MNISALINDMLWIKTHLDKYSNITDYIYNIYIFNKNKKVSDLKKKNS